MISTSLQESLTEAQIQISALLVMTEDIAELYAWYLTEDEYYSRKTPWRIYLMLAAARETTVGEAITCGVCAGCGRVVRGRGTRECPQCNGVGTITMDVSEVSAEVHAYGAWDGVTLPEVTDGYRDYCANAERRTDTRGEPCNRHAEIGCAWCIPGPYVT